MSMYPVISYSICYMCTSVCFMCSSCFPWTKKGITPAKNSEYLKTFCTKRSYKNGQMVKYQCLNILLLSPASGCMAVNTWYNGRDEWQKCPPLINRPITQKYLQHMLAFNGIIQLLFVSRMMSIRRSYSDDVYTLLGVVALVIIEYSPDFDTTWFGEL